LFEDMGKGRRICFPIVIGFLVVAKLQIWGAESTFVTASLYTPTCLAPGHFTSTRTTLIPTTGFLDPPGMDYLAVVGGPSLHF
jgi:hypothetical protein